MHKTLWFFLAVSPVAAYSQVPNASARKIPIRATQIVAQSTESLGTQVTVRVLSNGSALVNDFGRRRVLLFNAMLDQFRVVLDSASNSATSQASAQLIRYTADSTLFVDMASQSLLVLDPKGTVARVMALPKPRDARFIGGSAFGAPQVDEHGNLIYRALFPPSAKPSPSDSIITFPTQPDSAPILRANFDTRTVDTIASIKVPQSEAMTQTQDARGNVTMKITVNPMGAGDEWAMLPDGTLAIVREHDYHIDWIDPDKTRRSTARMPFDWKPITAEDKQLRLDSVRVVMQRQLDQSPPRFVDTPDGRRQLRTVFDFVPLHELPEFEPPIAPGALKADLNNHLWILPRTSASALNGLLYDVVNKRGDIEYRVQLPKGHALAGFGPNNEIYLLSVIGKIGNLVTARLR